MNIKSLGTLFVTGAVMALGSHAANEAVQIAKDPVRKAKVKKKLNNIKKAVVTKVK